MVSSVLASNNNHYLNYWTNFLGNRKDKGVIMDIESALLDLYAFRAKYAEAVKSGLLTEREVYLRWLV